MDIQSLVVLLAILAACFAWVRFRASRRHLRGLARVLDGDSLTVARRSIRIAGIDAPENTQVALSKGKSVAIGKQAAQALRVLVGDGDVSCHILSIDRYNRLLAVVYNAQGQDVGRELVRQGWAVAYGYQTRNQARRYWWAQMTARLARRGMWGMCAKVSPAEWRMANPRKG